MFDLGTVVSSDNYLQRKSFEEGCFDVTLRISSNLKIRHVEEVGVTSTSGNGSYGIGSRRVVSLFCKLVGVFPVVRTGHDAASLGG